MRFVRASVAPPGECSCNTRHYGRDGFKSVPLYLVQCDSVDGEVLRFRVSRVNELGLTSRRYFLLPSHLIPFTPVGYTSGTAQCRDADSRRDVYRLGLRR